VPSFIDYLHFDIGVNLASDGRGPDPSASVRVTALRGTGRHEDKF